MESEARIVIDMKEGVVEIEGTIAFVEKCLTIYAPIAKAPRIEREPTQKKPAHQRNSVKRR